MSLQGKVKWYNVRKGYGFITPIGDDAEEDIFVHATGIDGNPLQDDDEVSYDIKMDQGRPKAVNVTGGTGENRPYYNDRNSGSSRRFGGGDRYEAGGYNNNRGGNRYSNKYEGGSYGDRDNNRGGGFRSNNRSFGDRDGGSRRGFGMRRNFGGRGGGQQRNNICYSFRDTGTCRFGDSCCFEHTQEQER